MLNYNSNLEMFIKILKMYGIVQNYEFFPNAIRLSYGLSKIDIMFNKDGEGIFRIVEYHTELTSRNEQDILNIIDNLEKDDYV